MEHYLKIDDLGDIQKAVDHALGLKKDPMALKTLGMGKRLCLLFFNNSLRTRLSSQLAALNLGMDTMVMNFGQEGWQLEFLDGTIMNGNKAEHVKEAAQVVSQYCDIVGIRCFAGLKDKQLDEAEIVMHGFKKYASVPVMNLESATAHPLQALADAITIKEYQKKDKPKVVLSWAPHPKALPHAVANSFVNMMKHQMADFVITQPKGFELDPKITKGCQIEYDQEKALENADFVYVKNWSSYENYGQTSQGLENWMMTQEKLGQAYFMHCLPVRRNVVVEDAVLDSQQSLVIEQANNRTFAAQYVLQQLLKNIS